MMSLYFAIKTVLAKISKSTTISVANLGKGQTETLP